jgi:hypothetical protein
VASAPSRSPAVASQRQDNKNDDDYQKQVAGQVKGAAAKEQKQ